MQAVSCPWGSPLVSGVTGFCPSLGKAEDTFTPEAWPVKSVFRLLSVVTVEDWGVLFGFSAHEKPLGNSLGTQCHLQHVQDHGRQVKEEDPTNPRDSVRSQWDRWGVIILRRKSWRCWCLEINSLSSYAAEVLIWGISEFNFPLFKVVVNDFLLFVCVHCCARPWCVTAGNSC